MLFFLIPPIDQVKLQLTELTKHAYTVGYGKGKGRILRRAQTEVWFALSASNTMEVTGTGILVGADENLLIEYHVRTNHKTAKKQSRVKSCSSRIFL